MPSSRGSSPSRVYKYITKQEIWGQGESTCSTILSMIFMLVVQTSLCTFQLTTLLRLPIGPETKSKFFYLPLWSHWSPYLTRRHSRLHPMASGPLYLHLFLPNTPRQLLLNLQVATLVSLWCWHPQSANPAPLLTLNYLKMGLPQIQCRLGPDWVPSLCCWLNGGVLASALGLGRQLQKHLGSNPSSTVSWLCDLRQVS